MDKNKNISKKKFPIIPFVWFIFSLIVIFIILWIFFIINKEMEKNGIKSFDRSIPIPDGFYFVGGTKDTGFVISDSEDDYKKGISYKSLKGLDGNQFVWVPVENPVAEDETQLRKMIEEKKYPMAIKQEGGYKAILYNFDSELKKYNPILGNVEIREPIDIKETYANTLDKKSEENRENLYQDSFNNMVESVIKYKGFYISRFEVGNINNAIKNNEKVVSKKGQSDIASFSWLEYYDAIKNMYNRDDITTEMIWGCQWDSTLRWMLNTSDSYYNLSYSFGNFSGNKMETGSNESYSLNNIYDMLGNVSEYTQTGAYTSSRVARGSDYRINKSIFSIEYYSLSYVYENVGSRVTLYMK